MNKPRDAATPQTQAWGLFLLSHSVVLERIEMALSAAELPPLAWYDVLWELEKADDMRLRMHELADRIVLPRYNLSRLADRLEQAQLIRREDCLDDRRGYYLAITPVGITTRKKMWLVYAPLIDALFAQHWSNDAARDLSARLEQVIRSTRGHAAETAGASRTVRRAARR